MYQRLAIVANEPGCCPGFWVEQSTKPAVAFWNHLLQRVCPKSHVKR